MSSTAKPRVLFLTSSVLDDRKVQFSSLPAALSSWADLQVWSVSARHDANLRSWEASGIEVEPLPDEVTWRWFPYRAAWASVDGAWDERLATASRVSHAAHFKAGPQTRQRRFTNAVGHLLYKARLTEASERAVGRACVAAARWPHIDAALDRTSPAAVVNTAPARGEELPIMASALRRGIPAFAYIHSFDNLSTKRRMLLPYDGYFVWSQDMADELVRFYPQARKVPVIAVGPAQYDAFRDESIVVPRQEFLRRSGIPSDRRVVLYALGSPNLINEIPGAVSFAQRVEAGELGDDVHLLVRPHPRFDRGEVAAAIPGSDRVTVQTVVASGASLQASNHDRAAVVDWVNSFRHADLVINLASTVTIDAAIFDRPTISLDFDPAPGAALQTMVHDIHRTWNHFAPLVQTGGVALATDIDDLVAKARRYLEHPELDRDGRAAIVAHVCGVVDGKVGERISVALHDEIERRAAGRGAQA